MVDSPAMYKYDKLLESIKIISRINNFQRLYIIPEDIVCQYKFLC